MAGRLLRALVVFGAVAVVGAVGGAQWARSQTTIPEGAFVAAQDGTRWVVGGGTRYRMSFVLDDANVVPTLRESNIVVSTVAEASAVLAGGSVGGSSTTPRPTPAPATPVTGLVGQSVTTCFGSSRYDVSVERAGWQRTAGGATPQGNAMWAVLVVNVTNRGTDVAIGGNASVRLVDERGREFSGSSNVSLLSDVAAEYESQQPYISIAPGITDQMVFIYEVAPDARTLTLRATPFQCTL